jgi:catechol 2,3-dioxygenase-like lactoylglutathione lyase family enzyme
VSTSVQQDWRLREVAPIEPGIVCVDIERMIQFYSEVLGLELLNDAETSPEVSTRFGTTPEGYRIVRLQTALGHRVKLVQPKTPPARTALPQWVYERQGIAYLTFVVADVEDVVAQLRSRGVRMVSQGIVEVRTGIFAVYMLDPEDNYVEFIEYRTQEKR